MVKTIIALKEGYNKELSSRIEEGGELKAIKAALIVLMDEAAQNRSIRTGEALPVARQTLTKASEDVLKMM